MEEKARNNRNFFNLKEPRLFGLAGHSHAHNMSKVVSYVMAKNIDSYLHYTGHMEHKEEWGSYLL